MALTRVLSLDPVEIPLTQGYVALIDRGDYELVTQFKWHVAKDRHTNYARRSAGRYFQQKMHNLLLGVIGVDHIDGNGLNNCRSNLRPATQHQNNGNFRKRPGTSSMYKGVCWDSKGKVGWRAAINREGQKVYLGKYPTQEEAAIAYDVAAKDYFGEFARLNFP